jgi:hypothetical protein
MQERWSSWFWQEMRLVAGSKHWNLHSLDVNKDNVLDLSDIRKVMDDDLQANLDPSVTVIKPARMTPDLAVVKSDSEGQANTSERAV